MTRAFLDAGGDVYILDGNIPCNMYIYDGTVVIEDHRVNDVERGTAIVTQDTDVREWALSVIERYRADAKEAFPEEMVE